MKRNKICLSIGSICLILLLILSGCGVQKRKASRTLKTIGKKSSGRYFYQMKVTNKTGHPIKAFYIKDSANNQYSPNLLKSEDIFKKDESRMLYYNAKSALQKRDQILKGNKNFKLDYAIQTTFDDGSTYELMQFPFSDSGAFTIHYDKKEKVAYVVYYSTQRAKKVSTRKAQIEHKQAQDSDNKALSGRSNANAQTNRGIQAIPRAESRQRNAQSNIPRRRRTAPVYNPNRENQQVEPPASSTAPTPSTPQEPALAESENGAGESGIGESGAGDVGE
jgi:hypothetical protein